ncbi:DUF883 family protein [Pseudoduganella danionis]|uniref:DUF883 domain-containing protein n=1 Tax=Pseudoduganella danionis TaxID=1890295 RepID=A0ABW9SQ05_9BURK|nr:hypothetical protein [Pseudoduganella danionis]MTW33283.1 hypothetical protein [Pseudoduganella danionis]
MDDPEVKLQTQERLLEDLRQVIENAEDLLNNTNAFHSQLYQIARTRLAQALHYATEELARFEDIQVERMIELTRAANLLHQDLSGEARLLRAFNRH